MKKALYPALNVGFSVPRDRDEAELMELEKKLRDHIKAWAKENMPPDWELEFD